ncbi:MAG: C1 family peptidase [Peptococcaceae bacterium]|nr:C1 family peptidase [Peptococcaceae bacterium]
MPFKDFQTFSSDFKLHKAQWKPKENKIGAYSPQKRRAMLGALIDEEAHAANKALLAEKPLVEAAPKFAQEVDWRQGNHVSDVKDQYDCGACASFSVTAMLEAMISIEQSGLKIDLSEADLHFCSNHGPTCEGWYVEAAIKQAQTRGITEEECFPYSSLLKTLPGQSIPTIIPRCTINPARDAKAVKVKTSVKLNSMTERKNHLTTIGPCVAIFKVYEDFYWYGNNVYHHVSGNYEGNHAVLVVGFSEQGQYWLCKNSWGPEWGDGGYFKIAYKDRDTLFDDYPFYGVKNIIMPKQAQENEQKWNSTKGFWSELLKLFGRLLRRLPFVKKKTDHDDD